MASNRHLGRIVALQTLYEYEFRVQSDDTSVEISEILQRNLARYDETIQPIAPDWPIDQVARIDRNVLRIGVYELLHSAEIVPPKVAINEAVELAKAFGSDNSSKFVNGVLGTAYRTLVEGADNGDTAV
jgi:N utilization substance protein B